ncbi:hypothetical protein KY290_001920 [Solanum tuberosum]|uniref:Uncharacterized protein n=1 Tax=Solanum tuberosum TaxID=4113 RepID=A0ABQ7WNJ5_SOLTU|nr:hypothetical protein KY290_001920 [Solanum tuberosum]
MGKYVKLLDAGIIRIATMFNSHCPRSKYRGYIIILLLLTSFMNTNIQMIANSIVIITVFLEAVQLVRARARAAHW